jgi:hypothetical protein
MAAAFAWRSDDRPDAPSSSKEAVLDLLRRKQRQLQNEQARLFKIEQEVPDGMSADFYALIYAAILSNK